ncbi:hypothetical protein N7526_010943 [Penicillium atrosanguineum]|nr:hypothetical protein N7526_010943 [Penicillium atrosanguineum]
MRDTSKAIPDLSFDAERDGPYERLQADLCKPGSLIAAVKSSKAQRAFIYLDHSSPDHMRSALQALKSAGINFIVFLSSFTVYKKAQEIQPNEIIPYNHAQVELNVQEIFGSEHSVILRPGVFVTNLLDHKNGISSGQVALFGPRWEIDAIAPNDIGEVAGTIIASGPLNEQHIIYLYGPQIIQQSAAIQKIGQILEKNVQILELDATERLARYAQTGASKPFAKYMVELMNRNSADASSYRVNYEEGVQNVAMYTGHPATSFEEVVENRLKG